MSMNIYPFQEPAAFALCGEAAKLIWKQVADEDDEFNTDELSDLWCDLFDARWSNSFCGEIESLFPELTKNPLEQSYDDEELTVIPCDREPKLFEAAYANKEELLEEFKDKLADAGHRDAGGLRLVALHRKGLWHRFQLRRETRWKTKT